MTETNYLFDQIFKSNETKEKIFLINDSKKLSYIEFHKVVNKISNYLIELALSPGDRVAVQAEKNIIQLALYVATIKAGGVYLPLNTGYTINELEYFFTDAKPKVIVIDDKVKSKIEDIVSTSQTTI